MKHCILCGADIDYGASMCSSCRRRSSRLQLSRRDFLRLACVAVPAGLLGACGPRLLPSTATPTELPPSSTKAAPAKAAPTATQDPGPLAPDMLLVEAGSFKMGSADGYPDELPVHTVRITRPLYIGVYEVTFAQYDLFCHKSAAAVPPDSGWGRGRMPVQPVDWYGAVAYCNWLSEQQELRPCYAGYGKGTTCDFTANGYRLPTEAEWEYAARGGNRSQGYTYAGSDDPAEVAWYEATSGDRAHPGGGKKPNELGLYDMSGNVFEWCWDWWEPAYYASSPGVDPQGPPTPTSVKPWELTRVRRSSCWREKAESIRTTARSFDQANYPGENGFRVARTA